MRKILLMFSLLGVILTLSGCGKIDVTVKVSNIVLRRTTISATIDVSANENLTVDSCSARIFNEENELVTSKALSTEETYVDDTTGLTMYTSDVTLSGLMINTTYFLRVYGTYKEESKMLYEQSVLTNDLGTSTNPYEIVTVEDLLNMENDPAEDAYYELMNDLDLVGIEDFDPICAKSGTADPFKGKLDGNGYTISNLSINESTYNYIGFIGVNYGYIHDLNFEDVTISGERTLTSQIYLGLFGINNGTLANINVTNMNISLDKGGTINAGGLVGYNLAGTINDVSLNNVTININRSQTNGYIGGLVGQNTSNSVSGKGYITNSNITGSLEVGVASGNLFVGGLIGYDFLSNKVKTKTMNSFADMDINVKAGGQSYLGGLVGKAQGEYENVYALGSITYDTKKMNEDQTEIIDATSTNELGIGGLLGIAFDVSVSKIYTDININAQISSTKTSYLGAIYGDSTLGSYIYNSFAFGSINATTKIIPDVTNGIINLSLFDGTLKESRLRTTYYLALNTLTLDTLDITEAAFEIDDVRSAIYGERISEETYLGNQAYYDEIGVRVHDTGTGTIMYDVRSGDNLFSLTETPTFIYETVLWSNDVWNIVLDEANLIITLK